MKKLSNYLKTAYERNKFSVLAFIIPIVSMLIVYYFKDIIPFGEQMYLRSDCYHQYTPFLQILQEKLRGADSLFYSWHFGGGMNFWGLASYYLASPFNILLLIWPGQPSDFVSFSIVLKMGLAGFTTSYYLAKHFNKNSAATTVFGCAYALSSYFAALSWNLMWLDCLFLLPLIVLGLEKLVSEKKCKMYAITLGIALFSNYYIGFMICIFSVLYFLYLFFTKEYEKENGLIARLLTVKDFVLYSLLGGGISAVMVIPAFLALMNTVSVKNDWRDLQEYFSIFYVFLRSLIATPIAELKNYPDPNVYCTVAAFFLIPLFCMCKKINLKERVGKAIIAAILLFSMCLNLPTYVWHGFHYPNSLSARFSFLYIFMIVIMCFEAFIHIQSYKNSHIIGSFVGSIALILLLKQIYNAPGFLNELYNAEKSSDGQYLLMVYVSIAFIIVYTSLIMWYRAKPNLKGLLSYIMVLVVFCELTFNLGLTTIMSTQSKSSYYAPAEAYTELEKVADEDTDDLFYRAQTASYTTKNDGARFGFNSIATFCSVSLASTQKYYKAIGFQVSTNAYSHYGLTPVTAALYNTKYEFASDQPTLEDDETFIAKASKDALSLYRFNQTLPLGFMIKSTTPAKMKAEVIVEQAKKDKDGNDETTDQGKVVNEEVFVTDPFAVQNSFIKNSVPNGKIVFHKLSCNNGVIQTSYDLADTTSNGDMGGVPEPKTYDIYFYCMTSSDTITATINGSTVNVDTVQTANGNDGANPDVNAGATDGADANATTTTDVPVTVDPAFAGGTQKSFQSTNDNHICHIGNVPAGSSVTLSDTGSVCYAYAFDSDAWNADYEALKAHGYDITSFSDTKIEGTITALEAGIMYTSIPYEKGWSAYVDGEKVDTTPICGDSLTGVFVNPGKHTVTFKYTPSGFVIGLLLTIISILVLFYPNIMAFIQKKKSSNKKDGKKKK